MRRRERWLRARSRRRSRAEGPARVSTNAITAPASKAWPPPASPAPAPAGAARLGTSAARRDRCSSTSLRSDGERPWYIRVSISRSAKAKCSLRPVAKIGLGQGQVLRHLMAHGLMGAGGLDRPARVVRMNWPLAMTSRARRRPIDRAGVVPRAQQQPDLGHDHPLPEGDAAL